MQTASAMGQQFDALLGELLRATESSRTTLRLDWPELNFHVNDVAGEAVAPGEKSLRGNTGINQRAAATVQWLDRERRSLIQDDFRTADVPPPPALIAVYGAGAQMLAPVIRKDALQGWVSAHYTGGPHHWSRANVETIETVARRIRELIDRQMGG
jgi:GAF domain-containing protein